MRNISRFMDWHTVPLKGAITRNPDGSKTLPIFPRNWRQYYTDNKNTVAANLGGAITGEVSNILAIDCDNAITFSLFRSLDPDYEFRFDSIGKGCEAGTIIYAYSSEVPDSYSIADADIKLDVYSNGGFIYLPSDANETKAPPPPHARLKPAPQEVLLVLKRLQRPQQQQQQQQANVLTAACLNPLVTQFTQGRKFMPGLFKILTPKSFRSEPQYVSEGYLHPQNVPDGRGSEYLMKVSAILGADLSIDEELYCSAMHDINAMWAQPLPLDRLEATIIEPMINGKSSVDGTPIWQYDPEWQQHRLILHTKRQCTVEIGFDDNRREYYVVDQANERVQAFARDTELGAYISAVAVIPPSTKDIRASVPLVNVISAPNREFGFQPGDDPVARSLNTFIQTPELIILRDPLSYSPMYKFPTVTMQFLTHLVPEDKMRNFLLSFLKRKLQTFAYSPVVLYFLGTHGSGKDTFVQILEKIMGKVARPTTKEFLEMYNGWLLDTYFVQLDEYGNQLTTFRDKEEALGKLKAYTGKQQVQIRAMRTDGFQYKHNATFIATANSNPFGIEDGDRRIALFETPTKMTETFDDVALAHSAILAESRDFCYYLATETSDLTDSQYQTPPASDNKHVLIADSMYAAPRLAYALKHRMLDYIINLANDYGCKEVVQAINNNYLCFSHLENLYDMLTDYKGEVRALNKAMRTAGIEVKMKHDGERDFVYTIPK